MICRRAATRQTVDLVRRYGAGAALAAIVAAAFAALAVLSTIEHRGQAAHRAQDTAATAAEAVRSLLQRQRLAVAALAAAAAAGEPQTSEPLVDAAAEAAGSGAGAALLDPAGAMLADAGALDWAALSALAAPAVAAAPRVPVAPQLLIVPAGAGPAVIGFAQSWSAADGGVGGTALGVLDPAAFARLPGVPADGGIGIERSDGSLLFADTAARGSAGLRHAAIPGYPLMLRYRPPPAALSALRLWEAGALAVGIAAALLLAVLLVRQRRDAVRRAAVETALRGEVTRLAAVLERTDESTRSKSRFFAQITHELRTPLNAILGFSEAIRGEMFGPVGNARYQEYAALIHDAGAHLLSLINDLLDSARIEAGKMTVAPLRVAASALARSALDLVEVSAEGRGIELSLSGAAACPDLNVDPRALKQVLVNLLGNAVKFTLPGGRIALDFAARDDGGVTITVADTGIGMSPEELALAFEPFGRGASAQARREVGSGLGLSLARALVRLHGGDLSLASCLDAGTTASIALPAGAVFAAAPAPDREPAAAAA